MIRNEFYGVFYTKTKLLLMNLTEERKGVREKKWN